MQNKNKQQYKINPTLQYKNRIQIIISLSEQEYLNLIYLFSIAYLLFSLSSSFNFK